MEEVLIKKENGIATITFNRPDKYNSVTRELALHMQAILDDCAEDDAVKVIILTGAGRAFCAGQDLGEIVAPDGPDITLIIREHFNPIVERIRRIEKPIIAMVNGVAAGAGANLALVCDMVVAGESASFLQAFSAIGLIPDSGGTYTLPRLIGWQKASALMMLGDKILASEAERLGMIYKVYPDKLLGKATLQLAQNLLTKPPIGLALTKLALQHSMSNSMDQQLRLEDQLQSKAGSTEDYHEAVRAFVEKRKPIFKGR